MSTPSTDHSDFDTWLTQEIQPAIDDHIERSLQSQRHYEQLWYQIQTGGKRLRPGLVMLVGKLCECDDRRLLDCAAGVELLHTFSLVHDDLVDGDQLRRNAPAFWVEYGTDAAVNIGDMLLSHALTLFPDGARSIAAETVRTMTVGQQLDFTLTDRRGVSESEYMEMVRKKTGALFDCCLKLPQTLTETNVGIDGYGALWPAFQIRDDLLDFEVGKGRSAIGGDVRAGKRTLLAIHADDTQVYDILDKPAEDTTDEDVRTVQTIFEESGSFTYARQQMHSLASEAITVLSTLPDSPQRRRLTTLARYCTDRDH